MARVNAHSWYEEFRSKYRPQRLRILLIGESPPDPGNGDRRFFFSPALNRDNLYRSFALALYGDEVGFDVRRKAENLERIKEDGFWLIDAVCEPINLKSGSDRRRAIREGIPTLIKRVQTLAPSDGVIICHRVVYHECAESLINAGISVLHDQPIPFPLGNYRERFIAGVRDALAHASRRSTP